ncbi:MAG: hypothetical protein R3D98_09485 [Candidatus Krumholzibacteriia bacterium]
MTEYNHDRDRSPTRCSTRWRRHGGIAFEDITVEYLNLLGTWEPTSLENDPLLRGSAGSLYRLQRV